MNDRDSGTNSQPKKRVKRKTLIQSKWAKVYKDVVISKDGHMLDYITVSRSDSVIVIVLKDNQFVLGNKQFRPGINKKTLDFVGGRIDSYKPIEAAEIALRRELLIGESVKLNMVRVTKKPLYVDSAFSNQSLYGYIVRLEPDTELPKDIKYYKLAELLKDLQCLQCRFILLEAKNNNLLP